MINHMHCLNNNGVISINRKIMSALRIANVHNVAAECGYSHEYGCNYIKFYRIYSNKANRRFWSTISVLKRLRKTLIASNNNYEAKYRSMIVIVEKDDLFRFDQIIKLW